MSTTIAFLGPAGTFTEAAMQHFAADFASPEGMPVSSPAEALAAGRVPALAGYSAFRPEVRYGTRSRVDFLATSEGLPDAYVEVKNVHLRRDGDWAEFPDSVTARGARHLGELAAVAAAGHRAVMLYVVQRSDCGDGLGGPSTEH